MSSRRAAEAFAAVMLAAVSAVQAAGAQYLYKWLDKDGKTQYSDQNPKNPAGPVTRIELDTPATSDPSSSGAHADNPANVTDIAARRRAIRVALEGEMKKARGKLDQARAALAEAVPGDSERQVIQQRTDKQTPIAGPDSKSTGGMLGQGGMLPGVARMNCRDEGTSVVCPTVVPSEAYYERVQKLEDEVRRAEDEVGAAEQAYRRGVD